VGSSIPNSFPDYYGEFLEEVGPLVADGEIRYREQIVRALKQRLGLYRDARGPKFRQSNRQSGLRDSSGTVVDDRTVHGCVAHE